MDIRLPKVYNTKLETLMTTQKAILEQDGNIGSK